MTKFITDVIAAMLGVCLVLLMFGLAASDTDTKVYCDAMTNDPFSQTTCVVKHTLT